MPKRPRRGRDAFFDSRVAHGVSHIFGNPGTTENPVLDGLADYPSIRYISSLHEAVALSAATFFSKASRGPAVVNLHAAAGLGNALGALYGALKARAPIVVTTVSGSRFR